MKRKITLTKPDMAAYRKLKALRACVTTELGNGHLMGTATLDLLETLRRTDSRIASILKRGEIERFGEGRVPDAGHPEFITIRGSARVFHLDWQPGTQPGMVAAHDLGMSVGLSTPLFSHTLGDAEDLLADGTWIPYVDAKPEWVRVPGGPNPERLYRLSWFTDGVNVYEPGTAREPTFRPVAVALTLLADGIWLPCEAPGEEREPGAGP